MLGFQAGDFRPLPFLLPLQGLQRFARGGALLAEGFLAGADFGKGAPGLPDPLLAVLQVLPFDPLPAGVPPPAFP
jgi:hypothetical protein